MLFCFICDLLVCYCLVCAFGCLLVCLIACLFVRLLLVCLFAYLFDDFFVEVVSQLFVCLPACPTSCLLFWSVSYGKLRVYLNLFCWLFVFVC